MMLENSSDFVRAASGPDRPTTTRAGGYRLVAMLDPETVIGKGASKARA